jgi:hypothetical protein
VIARRFISIIDMETWNKLIFTMIVSTLGFVSTHQGVNGQTITAHAKLDTSEILLGDQVKLSVEVFTAQGVSVLFPEVKDTLSSKIEVLSISRIDTVKSGEGMKLTQEFLVTSFDEGYHPVPSFNILFTNNNVKDTLKTAVTWLTVKGLQPDSIAEIRDIKPPYGAPINMAEVLDWIKNRWHWLTAILVLVVGVVLFIIYLARRRAGKPILAPIKPMDPPHVIAFRELDKLKDEKLWQKNMIKLYYTRLIDILREYLTNKYQFDAMEMTSEEIILACRDARIDEIKAFTSFKELLWQSDLVKFAKDWPMPTDNERHMHTAYELVKETMQEVSEIIVKKD